MDIGKAECCALKYFVSMCGLHTCWFAREGAEGIKCLCFLVIRKQDGSRKQPVPSLSHKRVLDTVWHI